MNELYADVAIIIPARYKSSRYPGKPLIEISGKSLIHRTWERCIQAVPADRVYVATDDDRIASHCRARDIQVVMTGNDCMTGTDRVQQAAEQIEAKLYINVQGDEPLVDPEDIRAVIQVCQAAPDMVVTAMAPIAEERDFRSKTIPKVVARPDGRLLYMSRAPIPTTKEQSFVRSHKQVCIYGFSKQALDAFVAVPKKTPLEELEDIEILRFLELGYEVHVAEVSSSSIAVDTPEDAERVRAELEHRGLD